MELRQLTLNAHLGWVNYMRACNFFVLWVQFTSPPPIFSANRRLWIPIPRVDVGGRGRGTTSLFLPSGAGNPSYSTGPTYKQHRPIVRRLQQLRLAQQATSDSYNCSCQTLLAEQVDNYAHTQQLAGWCCLYLLFLLPACFIGLSISQLID